MCPLLAPVFQGFCFDGAIKSTNETNKTVSMCYSSVYITQMSMMQIQTIFIDIFDVEYGYCVSMEQYIQCRV